MKKIARRIVLALAFAVATVGLVVAPASTASAVEIPRSKVWYSQGSTKRLIAVASGYNGTGAHGFIVRGRRAGDNAPSHIRSVYVPEGYTLFTNGTPYYTAWNQPGWANVGKFPPHKWYLNLYLLRWK